jgi:hypothetical protein
MCGQMRRRQRPIAAKKILAAGAGLILLLMVAAGTAQAQVPHTILAMVRDDLDSAPPSGKVKFQAYLIDLSDGGVHSETRTDDDTGNAYGDGVMGEGWLEIECANFTQFEWANGDSLRLAIVNTESGQLLVTSLTLDAAVEPQLATTLQMTSIVEDLHGSCSSGQITVEWSLDGALGDLEFYVFRSTAEQGPYQRVTEEPLEPLEPGLFCYCDEDIVSGENYFYMLGLADFSDSSGLFGPIMVSARTDVAVAGEDRLPSQFGLSQNYPNPFNPTTTIEYQVPQAAPVQMTVFNVLGQQICTLVDEVREAGRHQVIWDGRDRSGRPVASGIYFCLMTAGDYRQTRKMSLLK